MDQNRLKQQIEFIVEIDKLKNVFRRSYITSKDRLENDSEHSWHFALMAIILTEYADEKIDMLKVVKMALIHDIVEIDAGDVLVYDIAARDAQHEKELKAAERIYALLPADQRDEFYNLWFEFEEQTTAEAKFAKVIDRLEPLLLNYHTQGSTWKASKVTSAQVLEINSVIAKSSTQLWDFVQSLITDAVEKGFLTK